jgi:glycosyltransferase involved in cell wall biosynthesis
MAENHPVVSIITPTFNHGKYLVECIRSVCNQSFRNWELLILDDGSTDETPIIAKKYCEADPRIQYHRQENIGIFRLAETYNKGLKLAKGEFIAILEGDDYWVSNKLELQANYLQSNPACVLSWGQAQSINSESGHIYGIYPSLTDTESKYFNNNPVGSILNIFYFNNCIPALSMLIRKNALLQIGGFKQPYNLPLVDIPTLYELALIGEFNFIPQPLGSWRIYASQVTKTYTAQIMEGFHTLAITAFTEHSRLNSFDFSVTVRKLKQHYRRQRIIAYSRAGRYKLIRKEFNNARKDYMKSISIGYLQEPLWKLRSLIGIIFSLFHRDVESFSKFLGKKSYTQ